MGEESPAHKEYRTEVVQSIPKGRYIAWQRWKVRLSGGDVASGPTRVTIPECPGRYI